MSDPAPAPLAPLRHGVVVVHGQGSHEPGEFLASVVNPIANELENAGGTVQRDFAVVDGKARARLVVTPPPSAGTHTEEFEFAEAYWAKSFLPPSSDEVARWILKRGPREITAMVRGWVGDPANDDPEPAGLARSPAVERKQAAEHLLCVVNRRPEPGPAYQASRAVRWLYRAQLLAVLAVLVVVVYPLTRLFAFLIYLLYRLGGTKGKGFFSFFTKAGEILAKLNPFLRDTLGDTQRFIEDGLWSVAMRAPVEDAIVAFYADPDIADITVIAHSEGCAVTYDSLALDRRVAEAAGKLPSPKRLTLVTLGSAINRNYGFSGDSGTSPYAQRLATTPLDHRITGVPPDRWGDLVPAETLEEMNRLRSCFYWLDIHARMDYVPAGRVRAGAIQVARVDPCQLKVRRVINEDDLLDDHFAYFSNTDIVVPRLVRAIYGGEYPWQGANRRETVAITPDRLAHRTRMVLWLDLLRSGLVAAVVALFTLLAMSEGTQEGVSLIVSAWQRDDLGNAVTLPVTFAFLVSAARPLYGAFRDWRFGSL